MGGPAEVALVGVLFAFATTLAYPRALALIDATAGFAPLSVLISYIVRIATIAELTATVVPFVDPAIQE